MALGSKESAKVESIESQCRGPSAARKDEYGCASLRWELQCYPETPSEMEDLRPICWADALSCQLLASSIASAEESLSEGLSASTD